MKRERKCVSCNEIKNAQEMIKITKDFKTNEIIINANNFHFGRSAYICKNENCIKTALKKDKLSKNLKKYLTEEEKENINAVLNRMVVVKH